MKLTIVKLDKLTPQDEIDLAKIWPQQQCADWHSGIVGQRMIFAARFNDRLLAAVKVSVAGTKAELGDLCVREVTRRRGVGFYLIEDLQRQLPEIQTFSMQAQSGITQADSAVFNAFMLACGFRQVDNSWQKGRTH
ncbi:aspartate 1-decarboxylase autocleavage activator PanM [Rouxiella sp. S1S-2]|uniref:aspartate 1-decarboxylase autocleavage activator PanM n=1 Tax=Rouxiella sp. S1S-2 TaxID=2653856 RepID=UPI001264E899|nr:aspartate 1-decarboxylase autocleavage activator PanM [Rouxiella sp. S1S-2]KAB7894488.1 aspartate 1-decarboxylase autocleavage activator PanM [Rouxiella sp. S1S-2]